MVLNKILLELSMNLKVLDLPMMLKKLQYHVRIMLSLNRSPVDDVPKVLSQIFLVFNDHVMQYDATSHDLP